MLTAGVRRQLEFQDLAYAREYLERMKCCATWTRATAAARGTDLRRRPPGDRHGLRRRDPRGRLKTRATRFERVRQESARARTSWSTPPNSCTRAWRKLRHPAAGRAAGWKTPGLRRLVERRLRRAAPQRHAGGFLMLYARCATPPPRSRKAGLEQWLDRSVPQDAALVKRSTAVAWWLAERARRAANTASCSRPPKLAGRPDAAASAALRETALANEKCGPMEPVTPAVRCLRLPDESRKRQAPCKP